MKAKAIVCLLVAVISFSACSNKEVPKSLDSYIEANSDSQTDNSDNDIQTVILDEIPSNYKNINGNVFAVVKDGEIVSYKYGTKQGGKWTFTDCDENGKIIEKQGNKKTTTTKITSKSTTSSATTTTQASITSSSSIITVSTTQATSRVDPNSTTKQTTKPTSKATTRSTTKATTPKATTSQSVPFSYHFINGLSGLPDAVVNYFQYYIDEADIATPVCKTKKSGGKVYAMIYILNGPPVTIRGVSNKGVITYKLGSGTTTSCKVVEIKGYDGTITFNKV